MAKIFCHPLPIELINNDRNIIGLGLFQVSQEVSYQIFATSATFFVPLILILLLYWRIFLAARYDIKLHRFSCNFKIWLLKYSFVLCDLKVSASGNIFNHLHKMKYSCWCNIWAATDIAQVDDHSLLQSEKLLLHLVKSLSEWMFVFLSTLGDIYQQIETLYISSLLILNKYLKGIIQKICILWLLVNYVIRCQINVMCVW